MPAKIFLKENGGVYPICRYSSLIAAQRQLYRFSERKEWSRRMKRIIVTAAAALALMCVAVGCKTVEDTVSKVESVVSKTEDIVSEVVSEGKDMVSGAVSKAEDTMSDIKSDMQ